MTVTRTGSSATALTAAQAVPYRSQEKTMNSEDPWWRREDAMCLTLTRGKLITEVLDAHGARQDGARHLTMQEARAAFPLDSGTLLRTGRLGEWTFCDESGLPEGIKPVVLTRLSSGSETVLFFSANGMTRIRRFTNGSEAESFEPGNRPTLRAGGDCPLWESIHNVSPHPSREQVVEGVESYLGVRVNGAVLNGPLCTVFLPHGRRAPLDAPHSAPETRSARRTTLGRRLAARLRPKDLTWPKEPGADPGAPR